MGNLNFLNYEAPALLKDNESKKEGKDQESIQSSTTPDPEYKWESDNVATQYKKKLGEFNNAEHINSHNCEPIQSNTTYNFDFCLYFNDHLGGFQISLEDSPFI